MRVGFPLRNLLIVAALSVNGTAAAARVVRVEIISRADITGTFAGRTYERLTGRVYFAFEPHNPANKQIVDLDLAPRNPNGEVEAISEFVMLRPKDATQSADLAVIDIVNRGGMTTFVFNLDRNVRGSPQSAEFYGDALLMKRGITIVALGWQWDVPPGANSLHFQAPRVGEPARPITGLVRSDITIDAPTSEIPLGHSLAGAVAYPVANPNDRVNVLTVRDSPTGPRTVVPRNEWQFARRNAGLVVADPRSVYMAKGFTPGKIYEVVYRAKDPVVVGAGLAAVRDIISYLKYDPSSINHVRYGIGYGVSQTGRFIRHYLYQGFNADERGRVAFDGFFVHTAGAGRGSFNHRFAQPSRDAQPYSTFFYPTDVFPFASVATREPVTHQRAGLRDNLRGSSATKVFYVDGGHEYWGRAASLTHTTPDGKEDVGFLSSERRYVISSAQHSGPAGWPLPDSARIAGTDSYRGDPLDQRLALRALMSSLIDWVTLKKEPPAPVYPTLAQGDLVRAAELQFPRIPNLPVARIPNQPYRLDFGPRWSQAIIDREPPTLGTPYPVFVSRIDSLGNELGGIRSVEIMVPLATYYSWQLRTGMPAGTDRLVSFRGTFTPLPKTDAERRASGDSRASIESLYGNRTRFLQRVDESISTLIARRFLLPADSTAARNRMIDVWNRYGLASN
ncbi:MAG TPA: alpha/beta hydrolase domain-containing protein [Gemmatimonadaceae bacterium]|nr:alpha/beta hydrolase domain-containing protein [Gemmatimonadaceae bacterium]